MSHTTFIVKKHVFPGQHIRNFAGATRYQQEDRQYLEAKQYIPRNKRAKAQNGITIIGAPAISFPKEMYEPLWDDILDLLEHTDCNIRSIWVVDPVNQGQSGVINEYTQGDEPTWADFARDLLHMVNLFRDEFPLPIVGIGHSMGAAVLMEVARMHTRLFSSLIVMDPVIGKMSELGTNLIYLSSVRKDIWSSREAAERYFQQVKPIQTWDPRVMALWLEHGLRDTPSALYPARGKVTLQTTKANESWSYGRSWFGPLPYDGTLIDRETRTKYPDFQSSIRWTHPFYRSETEVIWDHLPHLTPSCLYLFPSQGPTYDTATMKGKVERTGIGSGGSGGVHEGKVDQMIIDNAGHLLPFDKPKACATAISKWLDKAMKEWIDLTTFEKEHRDDKSIDQMVLSERWMQEAIEAFNKSKGKAYKAKL